MIAAAPAPGAVPIELQWSAPPECPSEPELRAGVVELLGTEQASEPVRAQVRVAREGDAYSADLVLEVGEQRSERRLLAQHCVELADATALVIAVTIDPAQALVDRADMPLPEPELPAAPEAAAAPADPLPAATAARDAAPRERGPEPRASQRPGLYLRGLGGIDLGATPKLAGMTGGAIGVRGPWYRAELDGSWGFARKTDAIGDAGVGATVGRWSIGARGCGVPARGRIEVPLCAAIEGGALVGAGDRTTVRPHQVGRVWLAIATGPSLAVAVVPRLAVLIGADLVVPVVRARFVVGDLLVHRPWRVGMRALVGVELRLGARR